MYRELDAILTDAVREMQRLFQRYKVTKFDELNVLSHVTQLYEQLDEIATNAFREIGERYYNSEPHGDGMWMYLWLEEQLRTPSKTIKVAYNTEVTRKRDRLAEALQATGGNKKEYVTAMRLFVRMFGWFGIEVADEAVRHAREDDGIATVVWCSEHDDRVCGDCVALDGQVFPLNAVPVKPHPGCRCWLERVKNGKS